MRGTVLAIVLALSLAACGGETGDTTTTTVDGATTTTRAAATTTEQVTTTTQAATTTTAGATGQGGDDCVVGQWELDSEAFMENLTAAFEGEPDLENVTVEFVEGTYSVDLQQDGSFEGGRDGWSFQMVTSEGTIRITVDSTEQGTWSSSGSVLTVNQVDSTFDFVAQAIVDDQVIDLPAGAAPTVDSNAIASSSSYDCTAERLTLTMEESFVSEFIRVDG